MKEDVGSYRWFREYGYGPIKAIERVLATGIRSLIPFPQHLQERYVLESIGSLEGNIRTVSQHNYDPVQWREEHPRVHSPETVVVSSYNHLSSKQEYFSRRIRKKFNELEERVLELEGESKLPNLS